MQISVPYSRAMARKYPEQIVIAIARDARGRCNPITLGWTMITSGQPPMLAIAVGETRYSLEAIRHAGSFVLAFPSAAMAEEVSFFGTRSGRDLDKLAALGTPTQPATHIDSVLLAEAVANFECVVEQEVITGDHVLFVGRVVAAHAHEDENLTRVYTFPGGQYLPAGPEDTPPKT